MHNQPDAARRKLAQLLLKAFNRFQVLEVYTARGQVVWVPGRYARVANRGREQPLTSEELTEEDAISRQRVLYVSVVNVHNRHV